MKKEKRGKTLFELKEEFERTKKFKYTKTRYKAIQYSKDAVIEANE